MKISELIAELEKVKKARGDLPCAASDLTGRVLEIHSVAPLGGHSIELFALISPQPSPEVFSYADDPDAAWFERQKPLLLEIANVLQFGTPKSGRVFLCRIEGDGLGNLAAVETAHHHAGAALRGFANSHWIKRAAVLASGNINIGLK